MSSHRKNRVCTSAKAVTLKQERKKEKSVQPVERESKPVGALPSISVVAAYALCKVVSGVWGNQMFIAVMINTISDLQWKEEH